MLAYGSKRTYARCKVLSARAGRARKIKIVVKNRKRSRHMKVSRVVNGEDGGFDSQLALASE